LGRLLVGRGGQKRREEEESDGSSGSGMALLVEEEPTAPEVTWGLRERWSEIRYIASLSSQPG